MKCPICKRDTFIELEAWEPNYMGYGWSIKRCQRCGYEVKDKTLDGRFAGILIVINEPNMGKA
jgi:hypothetical protein